MVQRRRHLLVGILVLLATVLAGGTALAKLPVAAPAVLPEAAISARTTIQLDQDYAFTATYDVATGRLRVVQRTRLANSSGGSIGAVNFGTGSTPTATWCSRRSAGPPASAWSTPATSTSRARR